MRTVSQPTTMRVTRDDFYRMYDAGLFASRRVELIDGEIMQMPAMRNPHAVAVGKATDALRDAFGRTHWVRSGLPLSMDDDSEPEPDLAVVKGRPGDFREHPRVALLVVEVSDSTLLFDQTVKLSLYARNGITDYWIVNLLDRRLEVYRQPVADKTRRFGHRYASVNTFQPRERIAPLSLPRKRVLVADLLP